MIRIKFIFLISLFLLSCQQERERGPVNRVEKIESLYQESREQFPQANEIEAEALVKILQGDASGYLLVDVRSEEERAVSVIPGAISEAEFDRLKKSTKDRQVYVYCTIGHRSGLYTERLQKEGFAIYNLKGGVLSWAHAGGSFVGNDGKPTRKVHVYSKKYALLPDGYRAVLD